MEPILQLERVEKYYGGRGHIAKAVDDVSFSVEPGEFVGIMGPSGSGKTTLLNMIATIDSVSAGHIIIDGQEVTECTEDERSDFQQAAPGVYLPKLQPAGYPYIRGKYRAGPYDSGHPPEKKPSSLFYPPPASLVLKVSLINTPMRSPAASSKGAPVPARWPCSQSLSSRTSPPGRWIPKTPGYCWNSSCCLTGNAALPS